MSKISQKISNIFGFPIKEGEWEKYLDALDREGEPTRKHMAELIFAVCGELEELKKYVEGTTKGRDTHKSV